MSKQDLIFVEHAKEWLLEVFPDEDMEEFSPLELHYCISRYFDGGVKEFNKTIFEYVS